MVNAAAAARFAGIRAESAANRTAAPEWAKKSLSKSEFPKIFNRYLSDLYSPFAKRIGALGQAPTFPDDSEAGFQEVCVTLRRA